MDKEDKIEEIIRLIEEAPLTNNAQADEIKILEILERYDNKTLKAFERDLTKVVLLKIEEFVLNYY